MSAIITSIVLLLGCPPPVLEPTDSEPTEGDTDTDSDADSDTDSDADTDAEAVNEEVDCGESSVEILSTVVSGGGIGVLHSAFAEGCCPAFLQVDLDVDHEAMVVGTSYTLGEDPCDCICKLDASYRIEGLPSGTWTVEAGSLSGTAVIP